MKLEFADDHPLYAAYRRAILNRNDEEALEVLQRIVKLNAESAATAAELARLDAKVLAMRLEHLGGLLTGADSALVVAEIEKIETFGFQAKPEGAIWQQAQVIRCGVLLEAAAQLKAADRWAEALTKIDLVRRLQGELKFELPAAAEEKLKALEAWTRSEQEKDKQNREFQAYLAELQTRISKSEEKDTSARYVELPELRDDFEALNKTWRALTDFARPIPGEAAAGFKKRSDLLEAEIARRTALRRRLIVAVGGALVAAVVLIAWLVTGHMRAAEFSRQLAAAVAQRQVGAADRLLERARREKIGRADDLAAAESFSAREHALLANFEAAFNALPKRFAASPGVAQLAGFADKRETARATLASLAPDLKSQNEPRLQAFEIQWQNYLAESSEAVSALIDQWLSTAEQESGKLSYRAPLDQAAAQIGALGSLMGKINETESGFTNQLSLRGDLLQRTAAVQAKYAAYRAELGKLDAGLAALRQAHTEAEFSGGIDLMVASEFSLSPLATAAAGVQLLKATETNCLWSLLEVTNPATAAFVEKERGGPFVPEVPMPAEKQMLLELKADPAVSETHQRYRFSLEPQGLNTIEWVVAGIGFEPEGGWRKMRAWTASGTGATDTAVVFDQRDYGYFDGQYKLSPTQPIYHLESLAVPDETLALRTIGLEKVWPGGDAYGKPLLEVLDSLKNSNEGSPLFRAYLFLRMIDLMKLQPDAWGFSFCPAVQAQAAQLRALTGGSLQSGDWFLPAKNAALSAKLEPFFAAARQVSYQRQAAGILSLIQSISKSGVKYVGFVGMDGRPNFVSQSRTGDVYGYGAGTRKVVWLGANVAADQPLKVPVVPLSPLFALENPRRDYLSKAGVNPADEAFRAALPPLFQGLTTP